MISLFKKLFKGSGSIVTPTTGEVTVSNPPDYSGIVTSKVKLGKVSGAINYEPAMIEKAVYYVDRVVVSDAFRDEVLKAQFTSTNNLNNEEIYHVLTDGIIVVNVTMFYGSFIQNKVYKTVGLDNGSGIVFANRYFVKTAFDMGSLILHEYAHQKGFHHESAAEKSSVPYTMNAIFSTVFPKVSS